MPHASNASASGLRPVSSTLAVVLAAGEGKRMVSAIPKVLHKIAGESLLAHVLGAVQATGIQRCAVVVGPDGATGVANAAVSAEVASLMPQADVFVQRERRGTAHAVLAAKTAILQALQQGVDKILVLFGDTPLIEPATLEALLQALDGKDNDTPSVAVLGFEAQNPEGYGRLICDPAGQLLAIREHKDASAPERAITLCNGGLMALSGAHALALLEAVVPNNAQNEFYLTDVVALANARGLKARVVVAEETSLMGVNDRAQLALAEAHMQQRLRQKFLRAGVTMIAPETVFFSADTKLGCDVVLEPNVFFGTGVVVGDNVTIRAFSHLEGAQIASDCQIGPFARLRPGTKLAAGAHIGNFVELKNAVIGADTKISHLSYIGDAVVGQATNIGAGTITCNYDGVRKSQTTIGDNSFIGSNSALVAPVTIGNGAYVGSGSVITEDVPEDALALARGRQVNKSGWVKAKRLGKNTTT